MALIQCKGCGHMISDKAQKCPKCGMPIYKDNHSHITNETNSSQNKNKTVLWVFIALLICVLGGGWLYSASNSQSNNESKEPAEGEAISDADDGSMEDVFDVKEFIKGYYDADQNGGYAAYFEESNITFFNLEHLDKSEVLEIISSSSKPNTSCEFDWATLNVSALPSGARRVVYERDYYIHYESRTDKYRITTEMVISPNRKIQSLKDLETVKVGAEPHE